MLPPVRSSGPILACPPEAPSKRLLEPENPEHEMIPLSTSRDVITEGFIHDHRKKRSKCHSPPRHRPDHRPRRLLGYGSRYGKPISALRLTRFTLQRRPHPTIPSTLSKRRMSGSTSQASPARSPTSSLAPSNTISFSIRFSLEGAGSGFVIDTDGHILTNYHVIQGAQVIEVTLGDRSRFKAKLIGVDTRNDLALIKIDPGTRKLTTLPLGDSRNLP